MPDLKGKVALITGAGSGIGAATAVHFAKLGAKLSLVDRDEANLQSVAEQCISHGAERPNLVIGDVTVDADVRRMIESTIETFGRLDILVNNAGVMEFGSIETISMEQYDTVMNTNMRSAYQLTMLAVPHLVTTHGNIVNVSSVAGTRSFTDMIAYCISKAGVDQLTKCSALELAGKGVRVNSVNPGGISTGALKRTGLTEVQITKFMEQAKKTHPLGRLGQPQEVAQAIAFLASSEASFTTGAHLHVDGGLHVPAPQ